jgi:hypothetical protein
MSDAKDKTKESIDQGSVKAEQASEIVAEKIKGGADEKKLETGGATGRVKDGFSRASTRLRKQLTQLRKR